MKKLDRAKNKTRLHKLKFKYLRRIKRQLLRKQKNARKRNRRKEIYRQKSSQTVYLPKVISVSDMKQRKIFLDKLAQIKLFASQQHVNRLVLDLKNIQELHPCGTLLFIAELDCLLNDPLIANKIQGRYPSNQRVEELFQHVGVIEKLKLVERIKEIKDNNVKPWMYGTSKTSNGEDIANALPRLVDENMNRELSLCVTTGIAEAIANAEEHAYPQEPNCTSKLKNWWFFVKIEDDELSVVICDLGTGIPKTLPITWREEFIAATQNIVNRVKDGKCIELALKIGKTRSKQDHRGKGLADILKIVEEHEVGMLTIFSNRGVYSRSATLSKPSKPVRSTKESIRGTIVQWRVPVSAFENNIGAD